METAKNENNKDRLIRAEELYNRQNRLIHTGFSALGLPYAENKAYWLDLLQDIAGKPVAGLSALTLEQRRELLNHLKKQKAIRGNVFIPKKLAKWKKGDPEIETLIRPFLKRPEESHFSDIDKGKMLKKIEALLAEASRPWAYVHGMAKRMAKIERIEWCTTRQMHNIIAALMKDAVRHGRKVE